jgi:hypothetical protein
LSTRAFLVARRRAELPAFRRVLDAMPSEQWQYRPHASSPSALGLAWTLAAEAKGCCDLVRQGYVEGPIPPPPGDPAHVKALHDRCYEELTGLVDALDEAGWSRTSQLRVGGNVIMEMPAGEMLWFFFFDAIHHRGQLSTYIRPMGGKVPAIYGPSGDDPGR